MQLNNLIKWENQKEFGCLRNYYGIKLLIVKEKENL